jgi:hypothetical protein
VATGDSLAFWWESCVHGIVDRLNSLLFQISIATYVSSWSIPRDAVQLEHLFLLNADFSVACGETHFATVLEVSFS